MWPKSKLWAYVNAPSPHRPPAKIVIKTKEMWYKRERKAGCQPPPSPISTNTHTLDRQTISQPPHCSPLALEGAQRPPHLSPRPTTDLAAPSRPRRSHESSSINVNHQAFPRCLHHSTPLLWGIPSSSVLGPLSFTHWPQLRFLSTVGWGEPTLLCMLCEKRQGINTSAQTQTLLTCKCCEAVLQRFWTPENSRLCSVAHQGLKWLPCAAPSAPLLGCGQTTVLSTF